MNLLLKILFLSLMLVPFPAIASDIHFLVQEAEKEFYRVAQQAITETYYKFGIMYTRGDCGTPINEVWAVECFHKAALHGHVKAQNELGVIYIKGIGVPKDGFRTFENFKLAAAGNHPDAHFNLAMMYFFGDGVPQDYIKAHTLLSKAADLGVDQAKDWLAGF